jgi:hypothetical protein
MRRRSTARKMASMKSDRRRSRHERTGVSRKLFDVLTADSPIPHIYKNA